MLVVVNHTSDWQNKATLTHILNPIHKHILSSTSQKSKPAIPQVQVHDIASQQFNQFMMLVNYHSHKHNPNHDQILYILSGNFWKFLDNPWNEELPLICSSITTKPISKSPIMFTTKTYTNIATKPIQYIQVAQSRGGKDSYGSSTTTNHKTQTININPLFPGSHTHCTLSSYKNIIPIITHRTKPNPYHTHCTTQNMTTSHATYPQTHTANHSTNPTTILSEHFTCSTSGNIKQTLNTQYTTSIVQNTVQYRTKHTYKISHKYFAANPLQSPHTSKQYHHKIPYNIAQNPVEISPQNTIQLFSKKFQINSKENNEENTEEIDEKNGSSQTPHHTAQDTIHDTLNNVPHCTHTYFYLLIFIFSFSCIFFFVWMQRDREYCTLLCHNAQYSTFASQIHTSSLF